MNRKVLSACMICLGTMLLLILHSCKKETVTATGMDSQMYAIANDLTGYVWYKKTDSLLAKSSGSGHDFPFLRTRYNLAAASQLNGAGKVLNGAVFPEGSMIVKELFDANKNFKRYAILYKQSAGENADANGWIWGYINEDKTVAEPSANKGVACISCHSQANNIQYNLMNLYFP